MKIKLSLLALAACSLLTAADWNWMPVPAKYAAGSGSLTITQSFDIEFKGYQEPRLDRLKMRILDRVSRQTGMRLSGGSATLIINCASPSAEVQKLGEDESYKLDITSQRAVLSAANPLGILRGVETFLQLIEQTGTKWTLRAVAIDDRPRFPWRGLHIDVARHFQPVDVLLRNLDGMAAVKLNVFHWHLSDDQGFRVESKSFPQLQQKASDGMYYTQDQIRQVIAYARDRGIRVVPEFDIPGHTTAWLAAMPELASAPGPFEVEPRFGVFDPTMDPSKEKLYQVLDVFIGEMAALFPDAYFHIGGDEVSGKQWKASPSIQAFMRANHLKDNHELQRYFNRRIQPLVTRYGKRMEGWDEILDPDLPKDIVIQSWQGQKSLVDAARQGYAGLLSAGYYLDLMQPAGQHYLVDPFDPKLGALTPQQQALILGGEACVWTEYMTPEVIDQRIWPRAAAIAERFWSPANVRDVNSMYRRLEPVSRKLAVLGLTHRSSFDSMLERLAGASPLEPIRTLAEVVEPVKGYEREKGRKYTSTFPLNRLVDTARPESRKAKEFEFAIQAKDMKTVRRMLEQWRDNRPVLTGLLAETQSLSDNLNRAATLGLAVLDGKPMDRATLAELRKPRAELLLSILPGLDMLSKSQ